MHIPLAFYFILFLNFENFTEMSVSSFNLILFKFNLFNNLIKKDTFWKLVAEATGVEKFISYRDRGRFLLANGAWSSFLRNKGLKICSPDSGEHLIISKLNKVCIYRSFKLSISNGFFLIEM